MPHVTIFHLLLPKGLLSKILHSYLIIIIIIKKKLHPHHDSNVTCLTIRVFNELCLGSLQQKGTITTMITGLAVLHHMNII